MEDTATFAAHEARIRQLERSARRSRVAALLLGGCLGIALMSGQSSSSPPTSSSSSVPAIIGDAAGAHVAIVPSGLSIYDGSNRRRAFFGVTSDGAAGAFVYDLKDGHLRARIAQLASGEPTVTVYDAAANARLAMHIGDNGIPGYSVISTNNRLVFEANGADNGGYIIIEDAAWMQRVNLGMFSSGANGLTISDRSGSDRAQVLFGSNGVPGLGIKSASGQFVVEVNGGNTGGFVRTGVNAGTIGAYLGTYTDGSSGATIYNSGGTAAWHTP
jgi:hypothetical protein